MLDYEFDLKDRKTQIILVLVFIVTISSFYYFFYYEEEYKVEISKAVLPNIEKKFEKPSLEKKTIENKEPTEKKIEVKKIQEPKIENKVMEKEIKEKTHVLFSSGDSSGRYTIQLISNIEITIENKYSTNFVPMLGKIEDDTQKGDFTISLSEDYLDYVNDLNLVVKDITNEKRKLECSASFLSGVNINTEYKIKLEVSEDSLTCYIESEEELPEFIIDSINKNTGAVIINIEEHNKGLEIPEQFKLETK